MQSSSSPVVVQASTRVSVAAVEAPAMSTMHPPDAARPDMRGTAPASGRRYDLRVSRPLTRTSSVCVVAPGGMVAKRVPVKSPAMRAALLAEAASWSTLSAKYPHAFVRLIDAVVVEPQHPTDPTSEVIFLMPYCPGGHVVFVKERSPRAVLRIIAAVATALEAMLAEGMPAHGNLALDNILLDARGSPLLAGFGATRARRRAKNEQQDVAVLAGLLFELATGERYQRSKTVMPDFAALGYSPHVGTLLSSIFRPSQNTPAKIDLVQFRFEIAAARGLLPQSEAALPAKPPAPSRNLEFLNADLNSVGGSSVAPAPRHQDVTQGRRDKAPSTQPRVPAQTPADSAAVPIVSSISHKPSHPSPSIASQTPAPGAASSADPSAIQAVVARITDQDLGMPSKADVDYVIAFARSHPESQQRVYQAMFKRPIRKRPVVALKTLALLHVLLQTSVEFSLLTVSNDGFLAWIEGEWSVAKATGPNSSREHAACFRGGELSALAALFRAKAAFHRDFLQAFSPTWDELPSLDSALALRHRDALAAVLNMMTIAGNIVQCFATAQDPAAALKSTLMQRLVVEVSGLYRTAWAIQSRIAAADEREAVKSSLDVAHAQAVSTLGSVTVSADSTTIGIDAKTLRELRAALAQPDAAVDPAASKGSQRKEKKTKPKEKKKKGQPTDANIVREDPSRLGSSITSESGPDVGSDSETVSDRQRRASSIPDEISSKLRQDRASQGRLAQISVSEHGSDVSMPADHASSGGGVSPEEVHPSERPNRASRRSQTAVGVASKHADDDPSDEPVDERGGRPESLSVASRRPRNKTRRRTDSSSESSDEDEDSTDEQDGVVSRRSSHKSNAKASSRSSKKASRSKARKSVSDDDSEENDTESESSEGESGGTGSSDEGQRSRRRQSRSRPGRSKKSEGRSSSRTKAAAKGGADAQPRLNGRASATVDDERSEAKKSGRKSVAEHPRPGRASTTAAQKPRAAPAAEPQGSAAALAAAASGRKTPRMDPTFEIAPHEVRFGTQIGSGGFGVVFKGKFRGETVAIKKIHAHALSNPASIAEFQSEVAVLCTLAHPNILRFMGACVKPPNLMIITEFMARGTLFDVLHQSQMKVTWPMRRKMALDTCKGMRYLHQSKLLHRDLKSSNLMLDDNFNCKVGDFGLTRISSGAVAAQMTGQCGTFQYMAVEVLSNKPYSEKADVFSFGILLWELIARKLPYFGMQPMQVGLAVVQQGMRPTIPEQCPQPLAQLMKACWNEIPERRPSFAQIQSILEEMPDA